MEALAKTIGASYEESQEKVSYEDNEWVISIWTPSQTREERENNMKPATEIFVSHYENGVYDVAHLNTRYNKRPRAISEAKRVALILCDYARD